MRAVNLLPRDEQRARVEGARIPVLVGAGGLAAVTAVAVVLSLSASGTADDRRAELAAVEAAVARLPKAPTPVVTQGTLVEERANRTAALAAALSTRVSFARVLREVSYVFPDDAWLTRLEATGPTTIGATATTPATPPPTAAAAATEGLMIEGATYTHDSVARVLARLSALPSLDGVRLTSTSRVEPQAPEAQAGGASAPRPAPRKKGKTVVTFTVSARLRNGASS